MWASHVRFEFQVYVQGFGIFNFYRILFLYSTKHDF